MPASSATGFAGSAKRKRANEPKFYAVRVGRAPGVYHDWPSCMAQINGYKGAIFKSFPTLTDAEKFVAGQNPRRPGDAPPTTKYYAVKVGRAPGIYTDWAAAQQQIKGWKAPKHRCFASRDEAQAWMDEGSETGAVVASSIGAADPAAWPGPPDSQGDGADASMAPAQKKKKASAQPSSRVIPSHPVYDGYEPGFLLPASAQDGFDTNIVYNPSTGAVVFKTPAQRAATKLAATGLRPGQPLRIYTDGSALKNGQKGGFAGVGVYFGPNDERNLSEQLPGPRQTNQRAELTALLRALDTAPKDRDVALVTDSEYAINCATKWSEGWRRNGWKTANGKAVENKDLVENLTARVDERSRLGARTTFEWVKGHANHLGNVEADKLAVSAAKLATAQQARQAQQQVQPQAGGCTSAYF